MRAIRALAAGAVSAGDAAALVQLMRSREETTIAEAFRTARLSEAARAALLTPFLRGITLEPGLGTSSAFLRFVLRSFADGPAALPADGMQAIPTQLAEGLDVRTRSGVKAVGPGSVTLEDGSSVDASAVVVATAGLLDDAPARLERRLLRLLRGAPFPGRRVLARARRSRRPRQQPLRAERGRPELRPGRMALVSATVLGGGPVDLDALTGQLRGWFGRTVARCDAPLDRRGPPRAAPLPGRVRGGRVSALADGLYACGDHREHPSLNGALRSGRRAADAVLADLA